jgi:cation transport protein ChaC
LVTPEEALEAIGFLVYRHHARYAGRLSEERIVSAIAEATGPLGDCATYLFNTVAHLEELGVRDQRLTRLRDRVAAQMKENGGNPPDSAE